MEDKGSKERFLYLVQHGEAKTEEEDPERPLTERGKETAEQVAAWAASAGLKVDQIRHSGKRRAEETAFIFAGHLEVAEGVKVVSGLAPNDDVHPVAEALERGSGSVMLVGHLPFLNRLAGRLLLNDPDRALIRFYMGGLVCLVRQEKKWAVACLVPPDLVP